MAKKSSKDPIDDPPTAASSSSSSSEETSTQTPQSQKNSALNVKPIATTPMEGTSKAKKPRSKPSSSPVKAASTKRRTVSDQEQTEELKRSKKKAGEEVSGSADVVEEEEEDKKTGDDEKKQLFQRLFSDEDEIAVLKGLLDFLTKKGVDPFADTNAFHDFVKDSIHADVSKAQLMYKVRRLRKKFENNARRSKDGEDRTFSKPHEQQSFELSKRIWGKEGIIRKIDSKGNSKALDALKPEPVASAYEKVDDGEPMEVDIKLSKTSGCLFDKKSGVGSLEDEVLKQALNMVGEEKRAALEGKWKKLQIAELELFVERNELVMERAKLMLEFYNSQDA